MGLTALQLIAVAKRLPDEMDIRSVGLQLGLDIHDIDAVLKNERNVMEAAYKVLTMWRHSENSAQQAKAKLRSALEECGLQAVANDILRSPTRTPIENQSTTVTHF